MAFALEPQKKAEVEKRGGVRAAFESECTDEGDSWPWGEEFEFARDGIFCGVEGPNGEPNRFLLLWGDPSGWC